MASSMIEFGSRWFARSNINTFTQVHNSTIGIRPSTVMGSGDWFEVRTGPDRALQMPNAVSGKTIDFRSFRVTNHIVRSLYNTESGTVSYSLSLSVYIRSCTLSSVLPYGLRKNSSHTSASTLTKGRSGDSSLQGSAAIMSSEEVDFSIDSIIRPTRWVCEAFSGCPQQLYMGDR